eukprot:gb/GECG01015535.1/.p1 GENE.gb/GECG01015535.1/~~gb/GECG01015535.1/.p1  ORF type:complete len:667 (+),score=61.14 gb/GECG01015535.1/:1-2001(+)
MPTGTRRRGTSTEEAPDNRSSAIEIVPQVRKDRQERGEDNEEEEVDDRETLLHHNGEHQTRDEVDGIDTDEVTEEDDKPFPILQVFTLSVVLFSSAFSMTMLFPFVGPMVQQLGMASNENEYGFYAGYVTSAFMVGRTLSSFAWGNWSDIHGRKPVLAFGSFSLIFLSTAFGFSFSYSWAVIIRLLSGMMNGVVGTAKTCVSEICSEKQQAKGMATVTATWGLGLAIGPAFGGLLSQPVSKYPSVFAEVGILRDFPFLLPCLISGLIGLASWITCIYWLPETLSASARHSNQSKVHASVGSLGCMYNASNWLMFAVARTPEKDRDYYSPSKEFSGNSTVENDTALRKVKYGKLVEDSAEANNVDVEHMDSSSRSKQDLGASGRIFEDVRDEPELGEDEGSPFEFASPEEMDEPSDSLEGQTQGSSSREKRPEDEEPAVNEKSEHKELNLLGDKTVRLVLGLYTTWSLVQIMIGDVLPLYALAKASDGGLGLGTSLVGTVFVAMGSLLLIFQLCIYSKLDNAVGPVRLFRYGTAFQVPLSIVFPTISLPHAKGVRFALLIVGAFLRMASATCAFTSNFRLINNSVPREQRGAMNGLAMTLGSFGKSVGPSIGAVIFAWTMTNGLPFPLDYHFIFYLGSVMAGGVSLLTLLLPRSLEKTYENSHEGDT